MFSTSMLRPAAVPSPVRFPNLRAPHVPHFKYSGSCTCTHHCNQQMGSSPRAERFWARFYLARKLLTAEATPVVWFSHRVVRGIEPAPEVFIERICPTRAAHDRAKRIPLAKTAYQVREIAAAPRCSGADRDSGNVFYVFNQVKCTINHHAHECKAR